MAVHIRAYISIEKSLTIRLKSTLAVLAAGYRRKVMSAVAKGEWEDAASIAYGIDLSPVFYKNLPYINYASYAAMLFGASRLTKNLKKSAVAKGDYSAQVKKATALLRKSITQNVARAMTKSLLLDIKDAFNEATVQKGDVVGHPFRGNQYTDGSALVEVTDVKEFRDRVVMERGEAMKGSSGTKEEKSRLHHAYGIIRLVGTTNDDDELSSQVRKVYEYGGKLASAVTYGLHKESGNVYVPALASVKKGEGTRLMKEVTKFAKKHATGVELVSLPDAKSFYEKLGFVPTADTEGDLTPMLLSYKDLVAKKEDGDEPVGVFCAGPGYSVTKKAERLAQPFTSFRDDGDSTLRLVSQLHTSRLSAFGFTAEAEVLGVQQYQLTEQLDNRICPVCEEMHGKVFSVASARGSLASILDTNDPDELSELQPWPDQSERGLEELVGLSEEELVARNWHIPPFHPGCRGLLVAVGDAVDLPVDEDQSSPQGDQLEAQVDDVADSISPAEVPNDTIADFADFGIDIDAQSLRLWNKTLGITIEEAMTVGLVAEDLALLAEAGVADAIITAIAAHSLS